MSILFSILSQVVYFRISKTEANSIDNRQVAFGVSICDMKYYPARHMERIVVGGLVTSFVWCHILSCFHAAFSPPLD